MGDFIKEVKGIKFYTINSQCTYGDIIEFAGLDDDMYTYCGPKGEVLIEFSYENERGMRFLEPAYGYIPEKKINDVNLDLIAEEAIKSTVRVA